MSEVLLTRVWAIGVKAFRILRKLNLSVPLEPVFEALSHLIPSSPDETLASLPFGTLHLPPGYRDTRTVIAGLFQEDETELFNRLIKPGMTAVDVGAYVGYFTVLFSCLVGASGRVYA